MIRNNHRGFTILEVMIVVTLIGILLAISVPGFIKAREKARQTTCQENLIQIDSAVQRWMIDESIPSGIDINVTLEYLVGEKQYLRRMPDCPSSGTYILHNTEDGSPATCSIGDREAYPHTIPVDYLGNGS